MKNLRKILAINSEIINFSPSIGTTGSFTYDEHNKRVRYFAEGVFTKTEAINNELAKVLFFNQQQVALCKINETEIPTRIAVKLIAKSGLHIPSGPWQVEARMPLNDGSGNELLFLGSNTLERRTIPERKTAEDKVLEVALKKEKMLISLPKDFSEEQLFAPSLTEADIKDIAQLYQEAFSTYTIELNKENILNMINSSYFYVVRDTKNTANNPKGRIISACVAEAIAIPGTNYKISELTDIATLKDYNGKGLAQALSKTVLKELSSKIDIFYAEARSVSIPVNILFRKLGFEYSGRVDKQCILSGASNVDVVDNSPYESLNVWYLNKNTLLSNITYPKL